MGAGEEEGEDDDDVNDDDVNDVREEQSGKSFRVGTSRAPLLLLVLVVLPVVLLVFV